jgi:archaeal flagellin FlaB
LIRGAGTLPGGTATPEKNRIPGFGDFPAELLQIMHNGYYTMSENSRGGGEFGAGKHRSSGLGDRAFTGLEAALVLIAFVVVAAVFSYTILNTGFMVTQQSRNTIFTAVEQTTSTLDMSGNVYGIGEVGNTHKMYKINFTARIAPSGTPVDFQKIVLTYSNSSSIETLSRDPATYNPSGCTKNSGTWAVYQRMSDSGTGDNLLDAGEMFFVSACPSKAIIAGDTFTLEVKPSVGVALSLTRGVPDEVKIINDLH